MNGVINLKRRKMIFEKKSLRVVVPLDPAEGAHYTEPVYDEDSDDELDYIYQITAQQRMEESHGNMTVPACQTQMKRLSDGRTVCMR